MTNKEIAERLRKMVPTIDITTGADDNRLYRPGAVPPDEVLSFADELDPPRPKPGTVVWWRRKQGDFWQLGIAQTNGVVNQRELTALWAWEHIEYKPARFLAPGEAVIDREQVAVDRELIEFLARFAAGIPGWIEEGCQAALERDKEARMEANND